MDQFAARELGKQTQFASLELALEGRDFAGSCDIGYSCGYTNTIAWRSATTPLPMENDPRVVFERLFGEGGTTDARVRAARLRADRSILDSVLDKTIGLQQRLGTQDRSKLSDYLEAIRDVERRIQLAEDQSAKNVAVPVVSQPAGVPASYDEHAKLMFDLQVLAYQSDLTRVITFMMGREISGRTYPEIGVNEAHHPISHHQNDQTKIATVAKINTFHTTLFAYYLERLRATPDGDGSLLDHLLLLYGSGMSDSNAHSPNNLPILLRGRRRRAGAGRESRETPERVARQPAPEHPRQARRADRQDRQQRFAAGAVGPPQVGQLKRRDRRDRRVQERALRSPRALRSISAGRYSIRFAVNVLGPSRPRISSRPGSPFGATSTSRVNVNSSPLRVATNVIVRSPSGLFALNVNTSPSTRPSIICIALTGPAR